MSLYIIGKLFFHKSQCGEITAVKAELAKTGAAFFEGIDDMDLGFIKSRIVSLKPELVAEPQVDFRISATPEDIDATRLWIEAQTAITSGRAEMGSTKLGQIFTLLLSFKPVSAGGVALFDGSIDSIFYSNAHNCRRYFSRLLRENWDNMENPLIIWNWE